jgi:hypothetical protein
VLAEGAAAVVTIGHHPNGRARQAREQRHGMGQFVRLPRREGKGDRVPSAVGDHAGLCVLASTRAAKRFTTTSPRLVGVFLVAPAAFCWARIEVPSRKAVLNSTPRGYAIARRRSQTPSRDH